jgi:hypothetical protein
MFFLISGSAASGKTTIARQMATLLDKTICHDADERPATTGEQRWTNLEIWVQEALGLQQDGYDFLLSAHSPLGELLACPSAPHLNGIAACVLDCDDVVRVERMQARGLDPRWPPSQALLNWASWQRMHAHDPQWEPQAITAQCPYPQHLGRWNQWERGDPRWQVERVDTTTLSVEETLDWLRAWIKARRSAPQALAPATRWWDPE